VANRRGRHGHSRVRKLLFVALNGSCRCPILDDGTLKETVTLDDPTKALYVAPWSVGTSSPDFAPQTAVGDGDRLGRSTDEAEYLARLRGLQARGRRPLMTITE